MTRLRWICRYAPLVVLLSGAACASQPSRPGDADQRPTVRLPPGTPVAATLEALEPLEPLPAEEFARRRQALLERMGSGIAVLTGEPAIPTHRRFLQDHNFWYLTGVEAPNAALILDAGTGEAHLFVPRQSAREAQWEGAELQPNAETAEVTGIANVHAREEFDGVLRGLVAEANALWLPHDPPEPPPSSAVDAASAWAQVAQDPWLQHEHRNQRLITLARERFPDKEIRDLSPLLGELRWIKSPAEQEYMRRAGLIAALGANEAVRSTRPGYYEWEVAAAATFVQLEMGQQEIAFAPILASGSNVNTIHYTRLDRRIRPDDLVLMDYGADYGYYTSDITRTWAADGSFTPEQVEYYVTTALVRDSVIQAMRPGVTQEQLLEIAQRVVLGRGHQQVAWPTQLGYIGHFVGLSVHDPEPADATTRPFEAGVVFNVEPIIDMPDRGWHFRIEDTVLITDDGAEVLTQGAPIAPLDLNRLYLETGVVEWWKGTEMGTVGATPPNR
ncbi:MAG: aminopeptidase P N-terminal domain-containing protein [Longimicrobiales bacterium]